MGVALASAGRRAVSEILWAVAADSRSGGSRGGLFFALLPRPNGLFEQLLGLLRPLPSDNSDVAALQVLEHLEEVLYLPKQVPGYVGDILVLGEAGLPHGHPEQFLLRTAATGLYGEHADHPRLNEAAGKGALVHHHHRVERLAVRATRPRHEAVIRRVVHRRVERAVQNYYP